MIAEYLRKNVLKLSAIPRDLDSVITIDKRKEVDPITVGMTPDDVAAIWDNIVKLYRTGTHPAITVSIRRQGKILMSRSIGHARGNGPQDGPEEPKILATTDTPICFYSTSKAVTAMLMHMLAEEGLINLMDPVSFYEPEFGRRGKENITIHQILAHRGGIPGLPANVDLDVLWDEDRIWELLCDAEPIITDGSKLAYHAITGGFVLERVVRRVTGEDINAYIDRKIRQPMGMKYFTYGVEREHLADLARSYATGPRPGPLVARYLKRALGVGVDKLEAVINDPRFQSAIIPAGNLAGTANELSAFFQMMLDGGRWRRRRICQESTVARAIQEFGNRSMDRTLLVPIRYSAGMMLGDEPFGVWGPHSHHAFGHMGMVNKFAWSDPARELSVALLNTGIPLLTHHVLPLLNTIRVIGNRVPRVREPTPFALYVARTAGS